MARSRQNPPIRAMVRLQLHHQTTVHVLETVALIDNNVLPLHTPQEFASAAKQVTHSTQSRIMRGTLPVSHRNLVGGAHHGKGLIHDAHPRLANYGSVSHVTGRKSCAQQ